MTVEHLTTYVTFLGNYFVSNKQIVSDMYVYNWLLLEPS